MFKRSFESVQIFLFFFFCLTRILHFLKCWAQFWSLLGKCFLEHFSLPNSLPSLNRIAFIHSFIHQISFDGISNMYMQMFIKINFFSSNATTHIKIWLMSIEYLFCADILKNYIGLSHSIFIILSMLYLGESWSTERISNFP